MFHSILKLMCMAVDGTGKCSLPFYNCGSLALKLHYPSCPLTLHHTCTVTPLAPAVTSSVTVHKLKHNMDAIRASQGISSFPARCILLYSNDKSSSHAGFSVFFITDTNLAGADAGSSCYDIPAPSSLFKIWLAGVGQTTKQQQNKFVVLVLS